MNRGVFLLIGRSKKKKQEKKQTSTAMTSKRARSGERY